MLDFSMNYDDLCLPIPCFFPNCMRAVNESRLEIEDVYPMTQVIRELAFSSLSSPDDTFLHGLSFDHPWVGAIYIYRCFCDKLSCFPYAIDAIEYFIFQKKEVPSTPTVLRRYPRNQVLFGKNESPEKIQELARVYRKIDPQGLYLATQQIGNWIRIPDGRKSWVNIMDLHLLRNGINESSDGEVSINDRQTV